MLIVIWLNYWGTVKSSTNNLLRWYFFWVIVKVVLGNPNTSIKRCLSAEDTLTKSTLFYSIWCPQVASSPTRPRGLYQIHPRGMCDWLRCGILSARFLPMLVNPNLVGLQRAAAHVDAPVTKPSAAGAGTVPGTHQPNNLGVEVALPCSERSPLLHDVCCYVIFR